MKVALHKNIFDFLTMPTMSDLNPVQAQKMTRGHKDLW